MTFTCTDLDEALRSQEPAALPVARVHAETCTACRESLAVWEEITAAAPGLRQSWESPDLWPRIHQALAEESQGRPARDRRWWCSWNTAAMAERPRRTLRRHYLHASGLAARIGQRDPGGDVLVRRQAEISRILMPGGKHQRVWPLDEKGAGVDQDVGMTHQRIDTGQRDVAGRAPFAVGLRHRHSEPAFEPRPSPGGTRRSRPVKAPPTETGIRRDGSGLPAVRSAYGLAS